MFQIRSWFNPIKLTAARWMSLLRQRVLSVSPRQQSSPSSANEDIVTSKPEQPKQAVSPLWAMDLQESLFEGKREYTREEKIALLKARLKHDQFVDPKGPKPPKQPRNKTDIGVSKSTAATQPVENNRDFCDEYPPVPPTVTSGNTNMVDRYHTTGEDVLYKESEIYGEFNFRDTILEQLDLYWYYLKRMKARDPDAYGFYKQIGISVLPYAAALRVTYDRIRNNERIEANTGNWDKEDLTIPDFFLRTRPAFGAITYSLNAPDEAEQMAQVMSGAKKVLWAPKFIYFTKYAKPPVDLQVMPPGDIYLVTFWEDHTQRRIKALRRGGVPYQFPIWLGNDGKLRMPKTKTAWNSWQYHEEYRHRAKKAGTDVHTMFGVFFRNMVIDWERANWSTVRVNVHHDGMTASFGVALNRVPYFFQDRDYQVTEDGKRQRIFHVVRAHTRKDGAVVPMHFRGLRNFTWAGYNVSITIPGRDHLDFYREFNVGSLDASAIKRRDRKSLIMLPQLAKRFNQYVSNRVGAW